ncbi:Peptidoglycan biosynthesis protein MviN/MurJ, putative lipid II flippase [Saccharopolyspora antimicrobica]|uniref:Peptidoglycan biosynthesis protein MviN/MurJ (Putative lipid II flippase) n=1 Tax=Saccharopolyspora antimicrobica TaxID=455193 RepID=A0A1I4W1E4_9PSEU|nr:peptidoglycan biosynthesis protein MviN/MurJ (putative lipid II flippase) [Saccharopolyspora antimicrobica]SFN07255.1 Peptidoglycan biosynthesis protein MviN/MurJ, putative lipid II flippase [Saccharopolyspora antimicrobica]
MSAHPVLRADLSRPAAGTTVRRSAVVSGGILISRLTGLVRVVVAGAVLGPTYFANAFVATNMVPNLTYSVIAGPALALVIVPTVVQVLARGGTDRAIWLLGRLSGFLLIAASVLAGIVALSAPLLGWCLSLGIPQPLLREQAEQTTTVLVLLVAPQVVLYTAAALGAVAQQVRERFALAAVAPAAENVVLIAAVVVVGVHWGPGLDVAEITAGPLVVLGLGSTLAVAVHACLQLFGASRAGLPLRPSLRWRSDPEVASVLRRLRSSISLPLTRSAALYVLLAAASTVPGGVIVVQSAYTVMQVPTALGARAVSTVVLPGMSVAVARDDHSGFGASWRQALTLASITSLPPLLLLTVLAHPVASVLANGQLHSDELIDQLAACLAVIAVAQFAASVHMVGLDALFARLNTRCPRLASYALLAASLTVTVASLLVPDDQFRLVVLCGGLLAGELAGAVIVLFGLRAALRPERWIDHVQIVRALLACIAMVPIVAFGRWFLSVGEISRAGYVIVLGACGLASIAVYAGAVRIGWIGRCP